MTGGGPLFLKKFYNPEPYICHKAYTLNPTLAWRVLVPPAAKPNVSGGDHQAGAKARSADRSAQGSLGRGAA